MPHISRLDSENSEPAGCSDDDDLNVSDEEEELGALAFQMTRSSVVGASSGRGSKQPSIVEDSLAGLTSAKMSGYSKPQS